MIMSMSAHMHDVFILSDRQGRTDQHMTQMKTLAHILRYLCPYLV